MQSASFGKRDSMNAIINHLREHQAYEKYVFYGLFFVAMSVAIGRTPSQVTLEEILSGVARWELVVFAMTVPLYVGIVFATVGLFRPGRWNRLGSVLTAILLIPTIRNLYLEIYIQYYWEWFLESIWYEPASMAHDVAGGNPILSQAILCAYLLVAYLLLRYVAIAAWPHFSDTFYTAQRVARRWVVKKWNWIKAT